MMSNNQRIIAQQRELIHKLAWNSRFGCHTRDGFEHVVWPDIAARASAIVYFDIDDMHGLNERHGYTQVDEKIRQVLSIVRESDCVAGQYMSGDEFLICLTETETRKNIDPQGLVNRLVGAFREQDMKATFAIVPVTSADLLENVLPAVELVAEHKKARGTSR
jgi:GGDEF domain-containing protein